VGAPAGGVMRASRLSEQQLREWHATRRCQLLIVWLWAVPELEAHKAAVHPQNWVHSSVLARGWMVGKWGQPAAKLTAMKPVMATGSHLVQLLPKFSTPSVNI
jgi:hypothetical protein